MQRFCKTVNLKDSLEVLLQMREAKAELLGECIENGDNEVALLYEEEIHSLCCVISYMEQFLYACRKDGSTFLTRSSFTID